MGDTEVFSTQTIEEIQQKIDTYKETLAALKSGHSIEEILFMKKEFDNFKEKTTALESLIERQNNQIDTYKQEISTLSSQIKSLNTVVEELTENITSTTSIESEVDRNSMKQDTPIQEAQRKHTPTQNNQHVIPSYKQLQQMVTQAQSIEAIESRPQPLEINRYQQEPPKNSSRNPAARFNSEPNTRHQKSLGNLNEPSPHKRISYKFSNSSAIPLPIHAPTHQPTSETEAPDLTISKEESINPVKDEAITENIPITDNTEKFSMNEILTEKLEELLKSDEVIQKIGTIYQQEQAQQRDTPSKIQVAQDNGENMRTPPSIGVTENNPPLEQRNDQSSNEVNQPLKETPTIPLANNRLQETDDKTTSSLFNFFRKK